MTEQLFCVLLTTRSNRQRGNPRDTAPPHTPVQSRSCQTGPHALVTDHSLENKVALLPGHPTIPDDDGCGVIAVMCGLTLTTIS
eukprot:156785-Ditylum_brightwellii.AAC.1